MFVVWWRTWRWVQECDTFHFQRWVTLSSNHLNISSVWKSLVARCVCGSNSNAILLLAINVFVSSVKLYSKVSSRDHLKTRVLFEIWYRNSPKRTEARAQSSCKTSFQVGMDLKSTEKAEMQEDYLTSAVFCRCRVVFLCSFIYALIVSVLFQVHPYLKWSFAETFLLWFLFHWGLSILGAVKHRTFHGCKR